MRRAMCYVIMVCLVFAAGRTASADVWELIYDYNFVTDPFVDGTWLTALHGPGPMQVAWYPGGVTGGWVGLVNPPSGTHPSAWQPEDQVNVDLSAYEQVKYAITWAIDGPEAASRITVRSYRGGTWHNHSTHRGTDGQWVTTEHILPNHESVTGFALMFQTWTSGVSYKVDSLRIYQLVTTGFIVTPTDKQTVIAGYGSSDPPPVTYTVTNYDEQTRNYVVEEVDAGGNPQDYPWLSLSKTNLAIDPGDSDTVDAVLATGALPVGTYQAYLKFTDDASPPRQVMRQIDLEIIDCGWQVTPTAEINAIHHPVAYTVQNLGGETITYTVSPSGSCAWLDLSYDGGPLATGQTEEVTGTIDDAGLADGIHTCELTFENSCSPTQQETRTVTYAKALSVDLGIPDVAKGIVHVSHADGLTFGVTQGGIECRRNYDPFTSPADLYFYFQVDDRYALNGNNPVQHITIEYYDTGSGALQLQYDSPGVGIPAIYKDGGSVELTGSDTWKTHTFVVPDAWFGNRQNSQADFRIAKLGPAEYFYLNEVRIHGMVDDCASFVSPISPVAVSAVQGYPATPSSVDYTITNIGTQHGLTYTVQETDATGETPVDYPWLALSKAAGGPLHSLATDTVEAIIDIDTTPPMAAGTYTGYLAFDDSCSNRHVRQIDLTIIGCQWQVSPIQTTVTYMRGAIFTSPVFTVTNTGADGLTYTVEKVGTCPWLALDKTDGGPMVHNETDEVTAEIDVTDLEPGVYACDLKFTNNCTPADVQTRPVTLILAEEEVIWVPFHTTEPFSQPDGWTRSPDELIGWQERHGEQEFRYTNFWLQGNPDVPSSSVWTNMPISTAGYTDVYLRGEARSKGASTVDLEVMADGAWQSVWTYTYPPGSAWTNVLFDVPLTGPDSVLPGQPDTVDVTGVRINMHDLNRSSDYINIELFGYDNPNHLRLTGVPYVCHPVWADADGDGDVDQDDFAVFQRCYSGTGNPYPAELAYCRCFDRDREGDVDGDDLAEFEACVTGPGVLYSTDPRSLPDSCYHW